MTRYLALVVALSACAPRPEPVDSTDAALPAIDTLKPVTAKDTVVPTTVGPAPAPAPRTPTPTVGARDSAFSPPRGLPKLDTVPTKRPPR